MVEPHTSFPNGTVERAHRIIEWRTYCLLVAVQVLPSFWTETMSHAVHFINRLSVAGYSDAVLYCFWCSTLALGSPLDYLCTFGWTAYASLLETLRDGKLVPSGVMDIHVGHDLGSLLEEGICVYSGRGRWVHFFAGGCISNRWLPWVHHFHHTHEGVCLL